MELSGIQPWSAREVAAKELALPSGDPVASIQMPGEGQKSILLTGWFNSSSRKLDLIFRFRNKSKTSVNG